MIDIKISIGEEFTLDEVKKYGVAEFKIAVMPRVGERIFLSDGQLSGVSNVMRNRVRGGYNYVCATIYGSDGLPIVMLGKIPTQRVLVSNESSIDVNVNGYVDINTDIPLQVEIKDINRKTFAMPVKFVDPQPVEIASFSNDVSRYGLPVEVKSSCVVPIRQKNWDED